MPQHTAARLCCRAALRSVILLDILQPFSYHHSPHRELSILSSLLFSSS